MVFKLNRNDLSGEMTATCRPPDSNSISSKIIVNVV